MAKKEDWKTEEMPAETNQLNFTRIFSDEEFQLLSRGIIPKQMEDKWFIYIDNETINFHRSWTGHHIYRLHFASENNSYIITSAIANGNAAQNNMRDRDFEVQLLHFLIDRLLLSKPIKFPHNPQIEDQNQDIYKHALIGYGRSNQE